MKEPGKEPPVSAMAKMFDESILSSNSPKSPGVVSHEADEEPAWVMGARNLSRAP